MEFQFWQHDICTVYSFCDRGNDPAYDLESQRGGEGKRSIKTGGKEIASSYPWNGSSAASAESDLYQIHEPVFCVDSGTIIWICFTASCSGRRNHLYGNRSGNVSEYAYHSKSRRRYRTGDRRLYPQTGWFYQELF